MSLGKRHLAYTGVGVESLHILFQRRWHLNLDLSIRKCWTEPWAGRRGRGGLSGQKSSMCKDKDLSVGFAHPGNFWRVSVAWADGQERKWGDRVMKRCERPCSWGNCISCQRTCILYREHLDYSSFKQSLTVLTVMRWEQDKAETWGPFKKMENQVEKSEWYQGRRRGAMRGFGG